MRKNFRACLFILSMILTFTVVGCFGGGGGFTPPDIPEIPTNSPPAPTDAPTGYGTLEGTVSLAGEGGSSIPAENALVSIIDQGVSTSTDANGEFKLENISAGQLMVLITHNGSKSAGLVTVEADKTTVINVEMPDSDEVEPEPGEETATLKVIANSFYENDELVTVEYIRVWEDNNYNRRWYQYWDKEGNEGQSNFELDCYNAPKNKYYTVEVGWHNGDTQTKDTVYLYMGEQVEYIYHD
ncbi:MAG: carboxypeptidase-like regulatory domain-containing protein [Vulcanimicrobiota bacterium]